MKVGLQIAGVALNVQLEIRPQPLRRLLYHTRYAAVAGQITGLANPGVAETAFGGLDDAIGHLDEGLAPARQSGLRGGEGAILEALPSAHCDAGRYDEAGQHARAPRWL